MTKKPCPYLFTLLSLLAVLSLSCGKKQTEPEAINPPTINPQLPDIEVELDKQELFCGADRFCPSYLTKIAVLHKNKLKFCTGFLTDSDVVATSSSCLPDSLRVKNLPCDKDVYFFFNDWNQKPIRIGCQKVLEVSSLRGNEPYLWRSDVVYFKLAKDSNKRSVVLSRNGMGDMEKFNVWSVDQIDDYQGIIRKTEECTSVYNTYFNPLANHQSSPVMMLAGCEFSQGNSGSPILDYRGRVRGIISQPVDQQQINEVISMRILEKPLKNLVHISNYACAPMLPDQEVLNENECGKKLEIKLYDMARGEMILESNLFKSSIQKIEHAINESNRYLRLAVKLVPEDDLQSVEVFPKCFKNVSKWIGEFSNSRPFTFNVSLPNMKLKRSMNEFGRIFAQEVIKVKVPTNFQFQPRVLKNTGHANVFMWPSNTASTMYPSLSESCESLF